MTSLGPTPEIKRCEHCLQGTIIVPLHFFLRESFNLWRLLLMIALYHQTKTLISFWYRRRLNPKSLIQPSETLLVEVTVTHN